MRGWDTKSDVLFSYVSCEARFPKDHPLRLIRKFVAAVLSQGSVEALLSDDHGGLHARGPPSISDARAAVATLMSCPLVISAGGTVRLKWLKSCC
jgi:hypothetical protein